MKRGNIRKCFVLLRVLLALHTTASGVVLAKTEESRGKIFSFASCERMRSFQRTTPAPLYSWGARNVQPLQSFGKAGRKTTIIFLFISRPGRSSYKKFDTHTTKTLSCIVRNIFYQNLFHQGEFDM